VTVRRQWLVVVAIVAVTVTAVVVGAHLFRDQRITVGSRAPDFHAVTVDSVPVTRSLADYHGRVTLLNVWATWCIPCEKEMPSLQRMYVEHQSKGFRIAAVSVDVPRMEKEIREFVQRYGLTFDVLYDAKQAIARDYMTTGYPETFIVGKDGIIRYHMIGPVDRDSVQLRALLTKLLSERSN
jgi:peroxiredoxin